MPGRTYHASHRIQAMVGQTISHYRVLRRLGGGGMGEVYEARDLNLDRCVAVKVLSASRARSSRAILRFEREARAASALNHPHICTIHDFGEHHGQPFIVMELLDGHLLGDLLLRGPLAPPTILELAIQVSDALEAAHRAGIVHRDITPRNIFVTRRGDAKILDFGIAKLASIPEDGEAETATDPAAAVITAPGETLGTAAYMSPEQIRGEEVDLRTDLFSFGAVVYEMATGRRAFAGRTSALIFDAILHGTPVPPARLNPELPEELARIIDRALDKDPDLRYQSAADLKADFERLNRTLGRGGEGRPLVSVLGPRTGRRFPRLAIIVAGLTLVGAAAALILVGRRWNEEVPEATAVQVTSEPGLETEPAISPEGSTVAYASDRSGNWDIWVVDARGGPPQRLTSSPANETHPSWFPDGSALVFMSDRDSQPGIWRAPRFDGDAATLLVPNATDPSVSPDGKSLAFASLDASSSIRIAVASVAAPDRVRILTTDRDGLWDHRDPSWSPDGRTICYAAWDGLWLVSPDSGPARRLTTDDGTYREPVWSPTGSHVYFSSLRDGHVSLWRAPSAGGAPQRVTPGIGTNEERSPSFSRDGRRLAFATSVGNPDLVLHDLAGGRETSLPLPGEAMFPVLAPDRRAVYFLANRWGRFDIWAQPLSEAGPGTGPRPVTDREGTESHPACSRDGRWLAYHRVLSSQRDIFVVPTSGGVPSQITDHPGPDTQPAWSPDGTKLAFVSERDGAQQIWVQRVVEGRREGRAVRVRSGPGHCQAPVWSPDGSHIAFVVTVDGRGSEVAVVDADGSQTPKILTSGARAVRVRWDPASGLLLVSARASATDYELRWVTADGQPTGLPPPVALGRDPSSSLFDISSDGRTVVFLRRRLGGDVWILEAQSGRY